MRPPHAASAGAAIVALGIACLSVEVGGRHTAGGTRRPPRPRDRSIRMARYVDGRGSALAAEIHRPWMFELSVPLRPRLLLSNLRGDPAFGALMERIQRDGRRSSRESCRPKWP